MEISGNQILIFCRPNCYQSLHLIYWVTEQFLKHSRCGVMNCGKSLTIALQIGQKGNDKIVSDPYAIISILTNCLALVSYLLLVFEVLQSMELSHIHLTYKELS